MSVRVEDLELHHVKAAAPYIRMADRCEWLASVGKDVSQQLEVVGWDYARVAFDEEGNTLCMWGVEEGGSVWLAATTTAEKVPLAIHRHLREEFSKIVSMEPFLHCWADKRNVLHHKWLEWLGFKCVDERHYGLLQLPFKYYTREEGA